MIATLQHRGPDGTGSWRSPDGGTCLGHTRLAIIDLSDAGAQPMEYAGRYRITFNGEIYNHVELRKFLVQRGYRFASASDTEVILALYDHLGVECLDSFDGAFAFALWDGRERRLFCARDRFGEKPFYYRLDGSSFVFASEIKAIVAACGHPGFSSSHVFDFLLYGGAQDVHDPTSTFYRDIRQLDAATYLLLDERGRAVTRRYWQLQDHGADSVALGEADAVERFGELLDTSIRRRLRSDVAVGSSLSGGLDSSTIVATVARVKPAGQAQRTFSATFPGFIRDERRFAELVASDTGAAPFFVAPDADTAFAGLRRMMYHQEIPVGSASIAAQLAVMELARGNAVPVLLDGQGADEVLAGYSTFWPSYLMQLYRTDRGRYRSVRHELEALHGPIALSAGWRLLLAGYADPLDRGLRNGLRRLRRPQDEVFSGIHPDLVREHRSRPSPIVVYPNLRRQLARSTGLHALGELLRYADRNSMAHSVEVRLPFLAHELVEFVFSLPDDLKIRNGWTKYLLRASIDDLLPREIVWRKEKVGYEPPQEEWLRSPPWTELVHEAIAALKADNIIATPLSRLSWAYVSLYLAQQALA